MLHQPFSRANGRKPARIIWFDGPTIPGACLRFEIQYPSLAPHEVELQGTLAVLGRDPSCDIVINGTSLSLQGQAPSVHT